MMFSSWVRKRLQRNTQLRNLFIPADFEGKLEKSCSEKGEVCLSTAATSPRGGGKPGVASEQSCYLGRLKDSSLCREGRKTMGRFFSVSFGLLVLFLSLSGTGADLRCPPNSAPYRYFCYRIFKEYKTWEEAERFCAERPNNGHLVSIESMEEADFVAQLLSKVTENHISHFWIGLRIVDKDQQCSSEWTDGSSVSYDNLHKRESRKCFALQKETGYRTWFHTNCAENYPFVCKVPPYC